MENGKIIIYTDGSCLGNPGPGGWGVIILYKGDEIALHGREKETTNNRMEMTAIINALNWIHKTIKKEEISAKKIIIHSDSNLVIQSLTQNWKRKANLDLWEKIDLLKAWLNIEWKWVKAHATNKYNNIADSWALKEAKIFRQHSR